ncbi:uncharacterized protein LOC130736116 [Lotus japonicus]|uniref:uncharacterized protein LOC130736116 n=1 Tax=Lotus japonicus TaxID=34305 RepID=UPI00258677EF|nr:uncharacterized protein LOC130736116 [Lotus japonicus]
MVVEDWDRLCSWMVDQVPVMVGFLNAEKNKCVEAATQRLRRREALNEQLMREQLYSVIEETRRKKEQEEVARIEAEQREAASFHASIGMTPYEALYGRRCRTPLCWHQDGENLVIGPELVQQTTEEVKRIQEKMRISQSRQKSYADNRRKELEFQAGDHVFLRVTPMTGVGRAIKSKKLTPKFIGSYQITERVGPVAYRIALPPFLSNIHDVLHVSQLQKYMADDSHVLEPDDIQLKDDLTMVMPPIKITDKSTKRLRNKEVSLVKVIWNQATGDATWELESTMRESHPELFVEP